MREIKFRAWNTELKQMEYCTKDEYWCILTGDDSIGWGLYHRRDEYRILSGEYESSLMQYIGLKDKKGKEIYDCDAIKVQKYIWIVKWGSNRDGLGHGWVAWPNHTHESNTFFIDESILKGEIIGNTLENPKLIT